MAKKQGRRVVSEYSLNGFGQGITSGGGNLLETDDRYMKVYDAVDLATALVRGTTIRVVEVMNDLELGYYEIPEAAKGKINGKTSPIREHIKPIVSDILMETGVSRVLVEEVTHGLTIFSKNGSVIKHAGIVLRNCENVVIRNLEFDELWEWDDAEIEDDPDSGSNGEYDRNDWDYIGVEGGANFWVDHCTFHKAYDGAIDAKAGAKNLTISWSKFLGDDLSEDSWVTKQIEQLERDYLEFEGKKHPLYAFIRDELGLSPSEIMQVQAPHKKCHLIGANEFAADNKDLSVTLYYNLYRDIQDRLPRLRAGNAHVYNLLVDCQTLQNGRAILTTAMKAQLTAAGYHFGVTSNAFISTEGGALLVENSRLIDVTYPARNNQKSGNPEAYTGKILLQDIMYSYLSEEFNGSTIYRGSSLDPDGPLYPMPAPVIPFSWNNMENLPYFYLLWDTEVVKSRLLREEAPGSGTKDWTIQEWLTVTY